MGYPHGIEVVDTFVKVGVEDSIHAFENIRPLLRDAESLAGHSGKRSTIAYLYKDLPEALDAAAMVAAFDKHGVQRAMIPISDENKEAQRALKEFPTRFFADFEVDPNEGMEALRQIDRMKREWDIKAVSVVPAMVTPQVPFNDKRMYPIFAKCVELDIPICVTMGIPGPRVPYAAQDVQLLDEVCWFFPELRIVTRHGCEPWTGLAVKLMLKYPGLHYSTSAFAPKHYPRDIIDFANTRGAEKVIFAGYFPAGLTLERVFGELRDVPFRDAVWPKFLRENAERVFKLA